MTEHVSYNLQFRYTFGPSMESNHYHAFVTRMHLTRHIPELMPAIVDELFAAFRDSEYEKIGSGIHCYFLVDSRMDSILCV